MSKTIEQTTATKPLLVGLNNPLSRHPDDALWPYPPNCTGARIVDLIQLIDPDFSGDEYIDAFDRENLWRTPRLPAGRGAKAALEREGDRVRKLTFLHEWTVLFGTRVIGAVTKGHRPFFTVHLIHDGPRVGCCITMPHPSGRNVVYKDARQQKKAGRILLALARGEAPCVP